MDRELEYTLVRLIRLIDEPRRRDIAVAYLLAYINEEGLSLVEQQPWVNDALALHHITNNIKAVISVICKNRGEDEHGMLHTRIKIALVWLIELLGSRRSVDIAAYAVDNYDTIFLSARSIDDIAERKLANDLGSSLVHIENLFEKGEV